MLKLKFRNVYHPSKNGVWLAQQPSSSDAYYYEIRVTVDDVFLENPSGYYFIFTPTRPSYVIRTNKGFWELLDGSQNGRLSRRVFTISGVVYNNKVLISLTHTLFFFFKKVNLLIKIRCCRYFERALYIQNISNENKAFVDPWGAYQLREEKRWPAIPFLPNNKYNW